MRRLLNAIGGALLAVALGPTLAAIFAADTWLGELSGLLRWHLGLPAAGAFFFYALGGARLRVILALAVAGWAFTPMLQSLWEGPPVAAQGPTLRVASITLDPANSDAQAIARWVAREEPTVIVFGGLTTWWDSQLDEMAPVLRYPFRYKRAAAGRLGYGVVSSLPLRGSTVESLGDAGPTLLRTRVETLRCTIDLWGVSSPVPLSRASMGSRNALLRRVATQAQGGRPALVVGDLQATPSSPIFQELLVTGGLEDSRRGFGRKATWLPLAGFFGLELDHLVASPALRAVEWTVGPDVGNIHAPVLVGFTLDESECAPLVERILASSVAAPEGSAEGEEEASDP